MITKISVGLVDGFKKYLDRQFSSGSCALYVYTLSKVYLSVTNCNLTLCILVKNSEYDQEIPQSQTADNPVALRGRAAQPPPLLHADTKKRSK